MSASNPSPTSSDTSSVPGLIRSIAHRLAGDDAPLARRGPPPRRSTGATGWLNSEPLTPEGLRGRVVLVDFWTYTCINWLRTLPYVRAWAAKYGDLGLTVDRRPHAGVRVRAATSTTSSRQSAHRFGVEYPIADRQRLRRVARLREPLLAGRSTSRTPRAGIRYHHFGEGEYDR